MAKLRKATPTKRKDTKVTKSQLKKTPVKSKKSISPKNASKPDSKAKAVKEITGTGMLLKQPTIDKPKMDLQQVASGVKALLELLSKKQGNKPELFDEERSILLQVSTIKIPKCPPRLIRFSLPYSIVHNESEICLITADRPGQTKDHDKTIEHYETLLKKKNVDVKIRNIIPLNQLKSEYSEYELKLRLVRLFDFFLVDGRIGSYVMAKFGAQFKKTRRSPVSIKMDCSNLSDHIKKALLKVEMKVHPNGDTYIVQVGHTRMSEEELVENITSTFDALADQFPGGCENIRGLYIKSENSMAVPIYMSLKKNAEVPVPIVISSRPKHHKAVAGEVSTIHDRNVVVFPSGEVTIQGSKPAGRSNKNLKIGIKQAVTKGQLKRKAKAAKSTVTPKVNLKIGQKVSKKKNRRGDKPKNPSVTVNGIGAPPKTAAKKKKTAKSSLKIQKRSNRVNQKSGKKQGKPKSAK